MRTSLVLALACMLAAPLRLDATPGTAVPSAGTHGGTRSGARSAARRQSPSPALRLPGPVPLDDIGLADWTLQPFSDLASHGVLWRRGKGLLAWRVCSARAFGSLAAAPHGAKLLFDASLDVSVDQEAQPRFASVSAQVESWPLWCVERAQDGDLLADTVTVFSAGDCVVAALNLRNTGARTLLIRPVLHLRRDGNGLRGGAELSGRFPAAWLSLDRSQALGRRLVEYAGAWIGGRDWGAELRGVTLTPLRTQALDDAGLDLALGWARPQALGPGQSLRVPVLLAWGGDMGALQKAAETQWTTEALPKAKAYAEARARWLATEARLPRVPPAHARLLRRAALDLLLDDYGPEAALGAGQFSAQKGLKDAFFCVDTPLAALGWAELDLARAESAVLDLASFSAAAPAAIPPFTGEEKLPWDAAGLPLNGWVAWELYHRDPQAGRAAVFLGRFGDRLRNECAWWPPNRDGDGNGLYAYARAEEKPSYLAFVDSQAQGSPSVRPNSSPATGLAGQAITADATPTQAPANSPALAAVQAAGQSALPLTAGANAGTSPTALSAASLSVPVAVPAAANPDLESWSLALTSLVAWQMQAAAALAQAAGKPGEADQLLALSRHSEDALRAQGWDAPRNTYIQGLDGCWPLLLGLESDENRSKAVIDGMLLKKISQNQDPWVEGSAWEPWRVYLAVRTLCSYGYFDESRAISEKFIEKMEQMKSFPSKIFADGSYEGGDSAATAATIMEMLLERQEQEIFLTHRTGEFEARWLQFRSLDGSFYMKRSKLDEKNGEYASIKIETPTHGPILQEGAFMVSCPEALQIQIQSEAGISVSPWSSPGTLIFKKAHRIELLIPARKKMLVRFEPDQKQN